MMNKLKEQVNEYLNFIKLEKGLSDNTISAYRQDLMEFVEYLSSESINTWPTDAVDVNAFLSRQTQNKATSSIVRMISSLNKFYQWLARQNIQKLNPMLEIDSPKRKLKRPTFLTKKEMELLLSQPDTNKKIGIRDRTILEVFYATGVKASELINLKISDIYPELHLIKVFDGNKARLIPINAEALKWIHEYQVKVRKPLLDKKKTESRALFLNNRGTNITRQMIWQIIKRYCQMSGITKDVTPHTLRHTFTAHLLENGADLQVVQAILGYTDNTSFYSDLSQKRILQVYLKTHPRS